jgi:hypothetical protein
MNLKLLYLKNKVYTEVRKFFIKNYLRFLNLKIDLDLKKNIIGFEFQFFLQIILIPVQRMFIFINFVIYKCHKSNKLLLLI